MSLINQILFTHISTNNNKEGQTLDLQREMGSLVSLIETFLAILFLVGEGKTPGEAFLFNKMRGSLGEEDDLNSASSNSRETLIINSNKGK